jgi:hypothetical protein
MRALFGWLLIGLGLLWALLITVVAYVGLAMWDQETNGQARSFPWFQLISAAFYLLPAPIAVLAGRELLRKRPQVAIPAGGDKR